MIHYTCDRCKQLIDPEEDVRFVVKVEVHAAMEPIEANDSEDERDHLLEIHEILEQLEDSDDDVLLEEAYQRRRFDLCTHCYQKYIKNPVGGELVSQLSFSSN